MQRSYKSGATKRKLKKDRELQTKKAKGSIVKFIVPCKQDEAESENEISESNINSITASASTDENGSIRSESNKENEPESVHNTDQLSKIGETECNDPNFVEHELLQENIQEEECSQNLVFLTDPAKWTVITDTMIEHFIQKPPPQNMEKISETGKIINGVKRFLTENSFFRTKKNSEKASREWLILSESEKKIILLDMQIIWQCYNQYLNMWF